MRKFFLSWLAVLAWAGVIYYFSDQPDLKSSLPNNWDLLFRKIAHAAEFFVLTFLLLRAFSASSILDKKALLVSVFFAFSYAIFDEWHQGYVPGRSPSITDVFVDGLGIAVLVTLQYWQKGKG
jgi:VanZ family protein